MSVVDGSFDNPQKVEEEAAAPLAGGILQHGFQCGLLWGAALAAGARAFQRTGPGPQAEAEAIIAAQKLVEAFRAHTKNEIDCSEITSLDWKGENQALPILKFFVKGGPIGCFRLAARYTPDAFEEIDTTLSEGGINAPPPPVSCAARLVKEMGQSDLHAVMAAGFAGGIGLSGGACGALGAAIWIIQMNREEKGAGNMGFDNPQAVEAIERFLASSDYEFECSEIVGRKFEDLNDHAEYLGEGGCSHIISALAQKI